MPRPKKQETFAKYEPKEEEEEVYVNFHDVDEEGFMPMRDSAVVEVPVKRGKGKRSVEDMMASQPNAPAQAAYALERIASLEDQIARVLSLCSAEALESVLKQRPSMKRYAPGE